MPACNVFHIPGGQPHIPGGHAWASFHQIAPECLKHAYPRRTRLGLIEASGTTWASLKLRESGIGAIGHVHIPGGHAWASFIAVKLPYPRRTRLGLIEAE